MADRRRTPTPPGLFRNFWKTNLYYFGLNGNVTGGSYHVPFFVYPVLALGIYNHKFGYPKKEHGMSLQVTGGQRQKVNKYATEQLHFRSLFCRPGLRRRALSAQETWGLKKTLRDLEAQQKL